MKPTGQNDVVEIDAFLKRFLTKDPKYNAVIRVLNLVREQLGLLMHREELTLIEFIDLTSIEYDDHGDVQPKDDDFMRMLRKAMRRSDVSRETLKMAAKSGLTVEQIDEGPTSIRVPTSVLVRGRYFRHFVRSLNPEYHGCEDFGSLMRLVHKMRLHQKPICLVLDRDERLLGYYSPDWSLLEMRDSIIMSDDQEAIRIYNAKISIAEFECLMRDHPDGHIKIIYVGKDKRREARYY